MSTATMTDVIDIEAVPLGSSASLLHDAPRFDALRTVGYLGRLAVELFVLGLVVAFACILCHDDSYLRL